MEYWWKWCWQGKAEVLGEKPVPMPPNHKRKYFAIHHHKCSSRCCVLKSPSTFRPHVVPTRAVWSCSWVLSTCGLIYLYNLEQTTKCLQILCDIIYLTAIGLTPGDSSTVHIYTQTIHRTTQSKQTMHRTQFTNLEECGPCPVFARYTQAFALQLRKKHEKTSVRVAGECQLAKHIQNRACMSIRIHKHNDKST
jgi:hypothetical protein